MNSFYDFAPSAKELLGGVVHAERCARTLSLLVATGVIPVLRQQQHNQLHMTFCSILVQAFDDGGEFEAKFSSTAYNSRHQVPSATPWMLRLMVAQGLLEDIGPKQFRITDKLAQAVGPLELEAGVSP